MIDGHSLLTYLAPKICGHGTLTKSSEAINLKALRVWEGLPRLHLAWYVFSRKGQLYIKKILRFRLFWQISDTCVGQAAHQSKAGKENNL